MFCTSDLHLVWFGLDVSLLLEYCVLMRLYSVVLY